jgi:MoaA/NifB/PqqE/SkfB family radical SAM enzyme
MSRLAILDNDKTSGWGVARNRLKVLNHLEFSKAQAARAKEFHALSKAELAEYIKVKHLEFHPTDICNLRCTGCTYGHDVIDVPKISFPFEHIEKLALFNPASLLIAGGGEPTLYRQKQYRFQDMVAKVFDTLPGVQAGLITNGVVKPPGDWPKLFDWIRISIDAATPQTYEAFRGEPFFTRVCNNLLKYLAEDIKYVGVGFVFSNINIQEAVRAASFFYNFVRNESPENLYKLNVQYRAMRIDPPVFTDQYDINKEQIDAFATEVLKAIDDNPAFERFLREQTNIVDVQNGNPHKPQGFSRCYYAEIFKIVRANGDLRPCCVSSLEPDLHLGNLIADEIASIANKTFLAAERQLAPYCNARHCRMCGISHVIERGLSGKLAPSNIPAVQADLMF